MFTSMLIIDLLIEIGSHHFKFLSQGHNNQYVIINLLNLQVNGRDSFESIYLEFLFKSIHTCIPCQ